MVSGMGAADDNTVWMDLDVLAASYERVNGVRPNQLTLGRVVAEELEPEESRRARPDWPAHPPHQHWESPVSGIWRVRVGPVPGGWWHRFKVHRACRKSGGHYWHPADAMIEWFCCNCGADRDGMPRDGR